MNQIKFHNSLHFDPFFINSIFSSHLFLIQSYHYIRINQQPYTHKNKNTTSTSKDIIKNKNHIIK